MWFKKIISWIKKLFKKTKFDNALFTMGVEELRKRLKEVLNSIEVKDVHKLKDLIKNEIHEKFGNVKIIEKVLDRAIVWSFDNSIVVNTINRTNITKFINNTCDNLIKWYNFNL